MAKKSQQRGGVLHWVGLYDAAAGGGGHWSQVALDVQGNPTGAVTETPLAFGGGGAKSTPIDIAVTTQGDVIISHVEPNGVRVYPGGQAANSFGVALGADVPFGVAADPTKRVGYVVTNAASSTSSKIWKFNTHKAPRANRAGRAGLVYRSKLPGNATGLTRTAKHFYMAVQGDSTGLLVVRVSGAVNSWRSEVVAIPTNPTVPHAARGVAADPARGLIHFSVGGHGALYTLRLRKRGGKPGVIDLSDDRQASVCAAGSLSLVSFWTKRESVVWAQENATRCDGIYRANVTRPEAAGNCGQPTLIWKAHLARAAVIYDPTTSPVKAARKR